MTKKLPDKALRILVAAIDLPLVAYISVCKRFPKLALPMAKYMREVIGKIDRDSRRNSIIFDQLNPAYAKYYREAEVRELMERAGFRDVKTWHRHGYSWTVLGVKDPAPDGVGSAR